jgi:hypothetical protein
MSEALGVNNANAVVALSPHDELVAKVDSTIERAQRALLTQQHPEGYWQAPLEAHAEMNAEYCKRHYSVCPSNAQRRRLKNSASALTSGAVLVRA